MKIAISTDADFVSAHFGRCPSFTIAEIEEGKVLKIEEINNPFVEKSQSCRNKISCGYR